MARLDGKKVAILVADGFDAGVVRGRKLTSWPAIQTAGGNWVDEEVVVDNGLVTSRKPDDIPAFNRKMIEEIGEGVHAKQSASAG
jgi:protease I